jgi:ribosomal 30S subunit maturation factor RimM
VVLSPIGSITKSHGLKGAVHLKCGSLKITNQFTGNLKSEPPKVLWLGENQQVARPWTVEYLHLGTKNAYLKLREINSRKEADYLTGLQVFIPEIAAKFADLKAVLGYQARVYKSALGVGIIGEIDETNPQALFVIHAESKSFLVPAVAELIEKIDHEEKAVYFKDIEGLFPV